LWEDTLAVGQRLFLMVSIGQIHFALALAALVAWFEYEHLSVTCPFEVGVMGRPGSEEARHVQIHFFWCCESGEPVFGPIPDLCDDRGIRQHVLRPARRLIETEVLTSNNDVSSVLHIRKRHRSRSPGAATSRR